MSPEETEALLRTVESVSTLTLGAVLAVLITHRLTSARDRINGIAQRKRAFLAFMAGWRYEVGRTRLVSGGFEGREENFGNVISVFIHEAGLIRWDFKKKKRAEFDALCSAITNVEHPTVYAENDRENAKKAIDAIIAFVGD